ncbi:MAG: phosphoenolpyruvate hydrolase family protein [Acidimicrobiia bacterium]|nr:phosphoenolpyruvate hydrolase family protein [Acidimicrobiia bacterium]
MNGREALARLRKTVADGGVIIGSGAGTGISAKLAEAGGADLIIVYNSGRYRMAGRGSLSGMMPYGDANAIVLDMAGEVLPIVGNTPVLAGVCGTDPFRIMGSFLDTVAAAGFVGVQNFPTVGLIDGTFRQNLEETGISYDLEVAMIKSAREKGLLTAPYVFDARQAEAMTGAGADLVVVHVGLTVSGSIGAQTARSMDESIDMIQELGDAARAVRDDVLVLFHGGPIAAPEDVEHVLTRTTGTHGFFGASSVERLPVEAAVTETMKQFKKTARGRHTSGAGKEALI